MPPKISIIIPTYAPKDYLWECLRSINEQTLSPNDFEVLLILNGEKEPYFSSIKNHISNYKIKLSLLYSADKGVSAARNLGIQNAQGKFICFIDDDDWISNNYLENLLHNAVDNSIVVSNVIVVDEKTRQENRNHFLSRAYSKYTLKYKKSHFRNRSFFSSACCKIIPTNCIGQSKFDTKIKRGEDSNFMFSIAWKIREIRIADPNCIYYIRKRQNSAGRERNSFYINTFEFISQSYKFTYLYIKHFWSTGFLFYITRILGTFKNKYIQKK